MKGIVITVLVLSAIYAVRATTNGQGALYPFEITSLLTCHTEVKSVDGQSRIVAEPPLRLPYGRRVQQGDIPRVYLPQEGQFRQPPFVLDAELQQRLINFLNFTENPASALLTSVSKPLRDPPRACDILPALEGSAGQTLKHVEVVEETWPLVENRISTEAFAAAVNPQVVATSMFVPNAILPNPPPSDPTTRTTGTFAVSEFSPNNFNGLQFLLEDRYRNFINEIEEMCPLWIAKCPLTPAWVELPQEFFPRYLAQGTCSGKNCSYPRGLHCEEDFTYTVYVTLLRWDCCYNAELGQLRWDCGWRKVQAPVLCDCTCGCGPVFPKRQSG